MLRNKRILFLGSSVTYGYASDGISFADLLEEVDGCISIKEAVSGTTLVEDEEESYIARMKRLQISDPVHLFVCQLSTNDATKNKPLGQVSSGYDINSFDTSTIAGAIEYITAFAKARYHCPIVFYTSPKYDSPAYEQMVKLLYQIKDKWNMGIIDMWNDTTFNDISIENRQLYMADPIHPTKEGYQKWWLPRFEQELIKYFPDES